MSNESERKRFKLVTKQSVLWQLGLVLTISLLGNAAAIYQNTTGDVTGFYGGLLNTVKVLILAYFEVLLYMVVIIEARDGFQPRDLIFGVIALFTTALFTHIVYASGEGLPILGGFFTSPMNAINTISVASTPMYVIIMVLISPPAKKEKKVQTVTISPKDQPTTTSEQQPTALAPKLVISEPQLRNKLLSDFRQSGDNLTYDSSRLVAVVKTWDEHQRLAVDRMLTDKRISGVSVEHPSIMILTAMGCLKEESLTPPNKVIYDRISKSLKDTVRPS